MVDTSLPFTRGRALSVGLRDHDLAGREFQRILPATYLSATVPVTHRLKALGALAHCGPDAHASHTTAALLIGVPLPYDDGQIHVAVPDGAAYVQITGVTCHRARRRRAWVTDGVPVSAPADLFIELASLLKMPDLVAAGDFLSRDLELPPANLVKALAVDKGRYTAAARRAAALVRARAESPMETKVRLLLTFAGLPEPELNVEMTDVHGRRRRYDMVYRASRTIVEYDGRQHAESSAQWRSDLARREAIDELGWRVIVLTSHDVYVDPESALHRVRRVLSQRGEPGIPRVIGSGWRKYFGPQ